MPPTQRDIVKALGLRTNIKMFYKLMTERSRLRAWQVFQERTKARLQIQGKTTNQGFAMILFSEGLQYDSYQYVATSIIDGTKWLVNDGVIQYVRIFIEECRSGGGIWQKHSEEVEGVNNISALAFDILLYIQHQHSAAKILNSTLAARMNSASKKATSSNRSFSMASSSIPTAQTRSQTAAFSSSSKGRMKSWQSSTKDSESESESDLDIGGREQNENSFVFRADRNGRLWDWSQEFLGAIVPLDACSLRGSRIPNEPTLKHSEKEDEEDAAPSVLQFSLSSVLCLFAISFTLIVFILILRFLAYTVPVDAVLLL
ncbi:hypothetical protein G7Y89_g10943 [Cudoniella acicularis]|uniref:Uncharacterized protein n=1 Tax=Cudoniella acicularis TaxID=354080 RepID=A0A8H4RE32_9HELO|nr:hypothetical protein G7Y89_g10943 [Cudoniella acicularis]